MHIYEGVVYGDTVGDQFYIIIDATHCQDIDSATDLVIARNRAKEMAAIIEDGTVGVNIYHVTLMHIEKCRDRRSIKKCKEAPEITGQLFPKNISDEFYIITDESHYFGFDTCSDLQCAKNLAYDMVLYINASDEDVNVYKAELVYVEPSRDSQGLPRKPLPVIDLSDIVIPDDSEDIGAPAGAHGGH